MQAKVKDSYRFRIVRAFGGISYVKDRWTAVPKGREAEARKHDLLDVREDVPDSVPEDIPEKKAPPAPVEEGSSSASSSRSSYRRPYKTLKEKAEEDQ